MGKEERIRSLTKIYYSNPKVAEVMLEFAKNREVVPRYYEGFGKRPDTLQYPSDIQGLVKKGATSFHASEEIWEDPLKIDSEMTPKELNNIRKSWDLLIDIDSPFLDYSKVAANLVIGALEQQGVKNYGIKFSGSKGFHIIVPGKSFPEEFRDSEMKNMFPEWPRAICMYLMERIRPEFNMMASSEEDIRKLEIRTNQKKENIVEAICPNCNNQMEKDIVLTTECKLCNNKKKIRKSILGKKRVLRCDLDNAPLEIISQEDILICPECKTSNFKKFEKSEKLEKIGRDSLSNYRSDIKESITSKHRGDLDLVLVAPRHLFRMPYSLHEKTGLASVVLRKEELENFTPQDADPMKIQIRNFIPDSKKGEAMQLLNSALEWYGTKREQEDRTERKNYQNYEEIKIGEVTEDMFPKPIKKLLKGLQDGKKRGLFILITFFRSLNFPPEYISQKTREWNKKNEPPLKEGYVKSQVDWHLKQRKKILPPNYDNESFYKDLGLLEDKPEVKNPLVEVMRKARRKENN